MRSCARHRRDAITVLLALPLLLTGCAGPDGTRTPADESSQRLTVSSSPSDPSKETTETTAPARPL